MEYDHHREFIARNKRLRSMEYHIPKLPEEAKCKRCRGKGEIRLPSHNTIWCGDCFISFCERAVAKAMKQFGISERG